MSDDTGDHPIVTLDGEAFRTGDAAGPRVALETERLTIRELALDDAEFALTLTNEPSFLEFIGDRGVRTLEDARNYIATGPLASYARHGHGLMAVLLKDGGVPIGMCGVLKKDWLDAPDIGYAFLPQYWGRGYALEAAAAVLAHARTALGLRRVVAVVTPHNVPSIRLLEKLGMRFERTVVDPKSGEQLALFA
jgi:RimJ/RimL family protein N-acetyltransferase